MEVRISRYIIVLLILLSSFNIYAQSCNQSSFSLSYSGNSYASASKSVTTPEGETIAIGSSSGASLNGAWITKLSPQGNMIWNNNYAVQNNLSGNQIFYDNADDIQELLPDYIIPNTSSSYLVTARLYRKAFVNNNVSHPSEVVCGALLNVDKSGNILWSRYFINKSTVDRESTSTYCSAILKLRNGDIILYMTQYAGTSHPERFSSTYKTPHNKVVCLAADGNIKWQKVLNTDVPLLHIGIGDDNISVMKQSADGNIIIIDGHDRFDSSHDVEHFKTATSFHLFSLNPANGSLVWENSYETPTLPLSTMGYINPEWYLGNVTELPNGNLSIIATNILQNIIGSTNKRSSLLNLITDKKGNLLKSVQYRIQDTALRFLECHSDVIAGEQTIVVSRDEYPPVPYNYPVITKIAEDGQILSAKRYYPLIINSKYGGYYECFNQTNTGAYNVFFNETGNDGTAEGDKSKLHLVITDATGNSECTAFDAAVNQEEITWSYLQNTIKFSKDQSDTNQILSLPLQLISEPNFLTVENNCQTIPCCKEIIDTAHTKYIELCEGQSYTLPDNRIVATSGNYDVLTASALGCDSISFYKIKTNKNPAGLLAVHDTCFQNSNPIVINLDSGYTAYNWMGNITDSPLYKIYKPGTYYITASNRCISKTDSVRVYDKCDLSIMMPLAFTPNSDGINDVYRVPFQNKDLFVGLHIYNRYGQLIFSSSDQYKGWNGTVRNISQPSGSVFIYEVIMKGLSGNLLTQNGTFVLIR